ncbi:hypothetical protein N9L68_04620 [bacterium]|nr:hypothetical protein [bacterium]
MRILIKHDGNTHKRKTIDIIIKRIRGRMTIITKQKYIKGESTYIKEAGILIIRTKKRGRMNNP